MPYLNLATVRLCTESEGPGKRMAIWVQGCERRCPSCCNVQMQEVKRNIIVDTNDLIEIIKKTLYDEQIEGVSFIGGEPFIQAQGLAHVAEWCQNNGLSVLIFTGYLYEEILKMNTSETIRLLEHTDLLIDGPFIIEQYDMERDWVGSTNQRVLFLSDRYESGREFERNTRSLEVLISDKDILVNGWPFE